MRLQMQEKNVRSEKVLEFQNKERGRHVIDTMKKVRELAQERERIIDMVGTESKIAHRKCFVFLLQPRDGRGSRFSLASRCIPCADLV